MLYAGMAEKCEKCEEDSNIILYVCTNNMYITTCFYKVLVLYSPCKEEDAQNAYEIIHFQSNMFVSIDLLVICFYMYAKF